jgi:hypothetical protein
VPTDRRALRIERKSRRRRRWRYAIAALLLGFCVWFLIAEPLPEGKTLLTVAPDHGVDQVDLLLLPVLAIAAWLVLGDALVRVFRHVFRGAGREEVAEQPARGVEIVGVEYQSSGVRPD